MTPRDASGRFARKPKHAPETEWRRRTRKLWWNGFDVGMIVGWVTGVATSACVVAGLVYAVIL